MFSLSLREKKFWGNSNNKFYVIINSIGGHAPLAIRSSFAYVFIPGVGHLQFLIFCQGPGIFLPSGQFVRNMPCCTLYGLKHLVR